MLGTPPALILSQDQTLKFNLLERALIACSSLIALLLLSCVVLRYRRTADTRRAGCSLPRHPLQRPESPGAGSAEKKCLHALSSFQRTKDPVDCPTFPRRRAIQSLGYCPGPFWGNLPNLRRLPFPRQPFFRYRRKSLGDLLGQRDALDQEHRVNRVFRM